MLRKPLIEQSAPSTDWWASARTVEGGVLVGFAVLLLAVTVAVWGISGGNLNVVELSKWGAVTAGMLQVRAAVLATCLVVLARRHLLGDGAESAKGPKPVRAAGVQVTLAWLLALAMVALPLMIELPLHVPETGLVFALLVLAGATQVITGALVYRALAAAATEPPDPSGYSLRL
ncbi:hypothetical protein [Lysobacter silvisoli]|uniref:hypothetical protein n=1 Tax=Lysobacter silvisoli TaxID=2293254 RepID=UPI0011C04FAF|nr:hypothetical protein [Lysobacter silvisoli]